MLPLLSLLFLTAKSQVSTLTEGFETVTPGTVNPVAGWTAKNLSEGASGEAWFAGSGFISSPFLGKGAHGGSETIATNYQAGDGGGVGITISNWLMSPQLNLANGAQFRFWTVGGDQTYPDNLQVRLSTNGSSVNVGSTATSVGDFTTLLLEINPTYSTTVYPTSWTAYTVTISGLPSATTGRIAFRYYATDGGPDGSNSDAILIDDAAYNVVGLPVSLVQFMGEKNGAVNKLSWSTATETNNAGFEVQRSSDGINFTSLSKVASKSETGNSNSLLSYIFFDEAPLRTTNYYRLKQVDKDGKFNYSSIITIKGDRVSEMMISNVYPNPAKSDIKLIVSSPSAERITITITNLSGNIVLQKTVTVTEGDNQQQLNIQNLSTGIYFIKATCSNGCETAVNRFIKQ